MKKVNRKKKKKKKKKKSNLIPYPEQEYLSGSVLLLILTAPNKQPFTSKSAFKSLINVSNL